MPGSYYDMGREFPAEYGEAGMEFPGESMGLDAAAAAAPVSPLVRRDPRIEDLSLASEIVSIPVGGVVDIEINPKLPFRASRMMLAGGARALTTDFLVTSMDVNAQQQILSRDGVPGCVFGPDATHYLAGSVMMPGNGATIRIVNRSPSENSVQVVLFGEATRPEVDEDTAKALLMQSHGSDLARARGLRLDDLLCASPIISLTSALSPGPPQETQLLPKLPFRARRAMVIDMTMEEGTTGQWPYPAPALGTVLWSKFEVTTQGQFLAEPIDSFVFQPQGTHRLKGSIMKPGNGAYIELTPLFLSDTRLYQVVFFGPADTAEIGRV